MIVVVCQTSRSNVDCHAERSEASACGQPGMLRSAQHDNQESLIFHNSWYSLIDGHNSGYSSYKKNNLLQRRWLYEFFKRGAHCYCGRGNCGFERGIDVAGRGDGLRDL